MKYYRLYTIDGKRLEDSARLKRQIALAVERFTRFLKEKEIDAKVAEPIVTNQHSDYFVRNKVAVYISAISK